MQRQEQDSEQKLLAARTYLELADKEITQASPGESLYAASFKTYPDLKKIYNNNFTHHSDKSVRYLR